MKKATIRACSCSTTKSATDVNVRCCIAVLKKILYRQVMFPLCLILAFFLRIQTRCFILSFLALHHMSRPPLAYFDRFALIDAPQLHIVVSFIHPSDRFRGYSKSIACITVILGRVT